MARRPAGRRAAGSSDGPACGRGVAGSSDDPPPGDAIILRVRQYTCGRCGKGLYKSEALINLKDPSMDWQGDLNITCYDLLHRRQAGRRRRDHLPLHGEEGVDQTTGQRRR